MPIVLRAFACLAVIAVGTLAVGPAGAQQGAATTLPDVSVTAPSATPGANSYIAGGNPYFGQTRVEETSWPVIPCTSSRVGPGDGGGNCRRGPTVLNFDHGDANGTRLVSNCQIAHDLVISRVGGLLFEADSLIFDPYYISALGHQRQDCLCRGAPRDVARAAGRYEPGDPVGDVVGDDARKRRSQLSRLQCGSRPLPGLRKARAALGRRLYLADPRRDLPQGWPGGGHGQCRHG